MIRDIDIYRAAKVTIRRCGGDPATAEIHAAQRADELMAQGDMEGRRVWQRIQDAIRDLSATTPGNDDHVH